MAAQTQQRTSHPFFMYEAVRAQPDAIARVIEDEAEPVRELALMLSQAERVHLVGIGTSWHAALVGEHLLRTVAGAENARAWNSFEFCTHPPPLSAGDAVVVFSHRGTKLFSAQALQAARAAGAHTAVITGIDSSVRADLADLVVHTSVQERSAAFTVSHTTAITVMAMVAAEPRGATESDAAREMREGLERLPELVQSALEGEPEVREWVRRVKDRERFYLCGTGADASTAYEVALKIKEASYSVSEGFQLEQYLHGPFVATGPECVVTFIMPAGMDQDRALTLIEAANQVGAHTAAIVQRGDDRVPSIVDTTLVVPVTPPPLTSIVSLVPLQLFTYWLAVELGRNPDSFRLDDPAHRAAREKYQL